MKLQASKKISLETCMLMRTSWWKLMSLAFGLYVGSAIFFAILLNFGTGHVGGAETPLELFWFSVQTLSTVGYGTMHPATNWAHILVLVESFVGLVETAIVTAVLFSKFSRPKSSGQNLQNMLYYLKAKVDCIFKFVLPTHVGMPL